MLNHIDHFVWVNFLIFLLVALIKLALLHDKMIYSELSGSPFYDLLLHWLLSYESVYDDLAFLADSMGSVDSLQVNLWVPIWVKNNDNVCLMEVDTYTTGPCRKNEDLLLTIWVLKVINPNVSLMSRRLTINTTVSMSTDSQEIIKNIH